MTDKLRDAEREAFEAWGKTQGTIEQGWWFRQLPDGGYSAGNPDAAWKAWQARAALAQQDAQAVPQGEAIVEEFSAWLNERRGMSVAWVFHDVVAKFRAMLNAAPTPPAQQDAQVVSEDEIVAAWKSGMTVQYFVTIGHDDEWTDYTNPTPPDTSGTRLAWRVKPGQRSNAAPTPPSQQDAQCDLCGADRPFTGSCGGGRENPRALCFADRVLLAQQDAQAVPQGPEFTDAARAALLWVLWHHQGGSSPVGQPIRFALGMGAHDHLSEQHIAEAKRWAAQTGSTTAEFHATPTTPTQDVTWNEYVETACALIKAADDAAADCDYMLDSDDCIKVLRGQWKAPLANDHPKPHQPAAEGAQPNAETVAAMQEARAMHRAGEPIPLAKPRSKTFLSGNGG